MAYDRSIPIGSCCMTGTIRHALLGALSVALRIPISYKHAG